MPSFVISLNISCPECCPIIQYISNCKVCLLVGLFFDTLKSHNVSEVRKSPSPESTMAVYPPKGYFLGVFLSTCGGSNVKPSFVIGPYFLKKAILRLIRVYTFSIVALSGFVSL